MNSRADANRTELSQKMQDWLQANYGSLQPLYRLAFDKHFRPQKFRDTLRINRSVPIPESETKKHDSELQMLRTAHVKKNISFASTCYFIFVPPLAAWAYYIFRRPPAQCMALLLPGFALSLSSYVYGMVRLRKFEREVTRLNRESLAQYEKES